MAGSADTFEGYELVELLGRGGFGVVHKARQRSTGQWVAIKVAAKLEGTAEDEAKRTARFEREAKIGAELRHPNVVALVDAGRLADGRPFSVFSWFPSRDLQQVLAGRAPSVSETVFWMTQVLDALAAAHARGIVHRDLKPSNVLVTEDGGRRNALLIDFGMGQWASAGARVTVSGDALGTPGYGAPEQWRGEEATPASDLFSWGLLFLECLLGRPVYGGTPGDALYHLLGPEEVPLPEHLQEHPLGNLLRDVLLKDASKRAADARGVLARLDAIDLGDPTLSGERRLGGTRPRDVADRSIAILCSTVRHASREDALAAGLDRLNRVVAAHHGRVIAQIGGTSLAYWGYPVAHEADARRALRAALALVEEAAGGPFEVSVALHHALLGQRETSLGAGASDDVALGLVPVQSGWVVLSADFQRLVRDSIDAEPLGEGAYRVLGERADGAERPRSPWVGRSGEILLCAERWSSAARGSGQSCLIVGEPGIGKSRLVTEICERARDATPETRLVEIRCAEELRNVMLAPVIEAVAAAVELYAASPEERPTRFTEAAIGLGIDSAALAAVMPLFGLTVRDVPALDVSPQKAREVAMQALTDLLFGLAQTAPLIVIAEDLHWADETTLELLGKVLGRVEASPVYLMMTARPELTPSFPTAAMLQIQLARLDRADASALVESLFTTARGTVVTAEVAAIVERADGIPLFLEELATAMLDSDASPAEGRAGAPAVPATLRALLTARLDKLAGVKKTAQLLAVLGREARADLLEGVSALSLTATREHIDRLMRSGLVMRRQRGAEKTIVFKHALVRDAAYASLPHEERTCLHARVAATIEAKFPNLVARQPGVLATHHAEAGHPADAVRHATRAAQRALESSAFAEAIAEARRVLAWAPVLEHGARVIAELAANGVLTQAMMSHRGWADAEVKMTVDRSSALLAELPDGSDQRVPNLWALFTYHHVASNRTEARAAAREAVALADRSGDAGLRAAAHTLLGITLHADGASKAAREALELAVSLHDREAHRDHGKLFGLDTLVLARALLGHFLWHDGDDKAARASIAEAIEWAREIGHTPSLAIGLLYGSHVYQYSGDKPTAAAMTGEILALSAKFGLPAFEGYAVIIHGWATGNETATEQILPVLGFLGCRTFLSYYASLRADALTATDPERALAILDECLEHCVRNQEHFFETELLAKRAALTSDATLRGGYEARAKKAAGEYGRPRVAAAMQQRIDSGTLRERRVETEAQ